MPQVTIYHSIPKDLHAVKPKVSNQFSVRLSPGEKPKTPRKPDYYNGPPWRLLVDDTVLFFKHAFYLKNIVMPFWQEGDVRFPSGHLDELYPSLGNINAMVLHFFLIVIQSFFLLSLIFAAYFPFPVFLAYVVTFVTVNQLACWMLNGSMPGGALESTNFPECSEWEQHPDEQWIFLNGVAVG